jgi:hypothetical protein
MYIEKTKLTNPEEIATLSGPRRLVTQHFGGLASVAVLGEHLGAPSYQFFGLFGD